MEPSDPSDDLHSDGWRYILRLYAEPEIADLCLRLQAEAGVDVNILLFAAFAAARWGVVLDRSALERIDAVVRDWREAVVLPLRTLRRGLKVEPLSTCHPASRVLRDHVKANELLAEQIEFSVIMRFLDRRQPRTSATIGTILQTLEATVKFHAEKSGLSGARGFSGFDLAMGEISAAAMRLA